MAIGPLETFVFPGVYTKTLTEAAGASAAGEVRFPAIIGTGYEETRITDFEMIRGSSAINDNLILEELVTGVTTGTTDAGWVGGAQGTVNKFRVANFPIVTGDGTGKVATYARQVIVTVNDESVAVNSVNGLTGEVTLVAIPEATDVVRVNYYFKRRDTYIEAEDLSFQADGTTIQFKVLSTRICKGDNSGNSATDADIGGLVTILYNPNPAVPGDEYERTVPIFQVKVNNVVVTPTHLDGASGVFTLAVAPALGATVLIDYFTSQWQDTYDILPAATVNRLVKVGLSQDTADYSIGDDCVLAGDNRLHWGQSYQTVAGTFTVGSTPLLGNVVASLTDTRVYGRIGEPYEIATDINGDPLTDAEGNYLNSDGNKIFVLPSTPVKGTGNGTETEDPADIIAYVGADWDAAYTAGPVTVTKIDGRNVTLSVSPSQVGEEKVYVTYYENNLPDETWTITNELSGGVGVGRYSITSKVNGTALPVTNSGTGTVVPLYAGAGTANVMVPPITAEVETVTVTFDGIGGFAVTSTGTTGTGTVNTGYQGRTYIDEMTSFRVSFAMTDTFNPTVGQTVIYYVGNPTEIAAQQTWFYCASSNIISVPGMNVAIASTSGGSVDNQGDTVILYTYNKSGNEPSNGDSYYVSFDKAKTDYSVGYYQEMRDVYRDFGPLDITNRVVVAANLAFLNGARAVAIKQIQKETDSGDATVAAYLEGIDEFDSPLPNGLRPSLIQPLSTNATVHAYLKESNAIQSSIKYKNERTSVIGFAFGATPETVIQECKSLATEKLTAIYPDAAVLSIADAYGNEVEYIVDGAFIACAVAGRDVSPVTDIATPMTNATIVGFNRLYRRLDEATAALVTNAGCTVLQEVRPQIKIKMYVTTDMSNAITRDPRIVEVKHFVQQGMRSNLEQFVGKKNLPSIIPQITNSVRSYFSQLKNSQIIVDFKNIKVSQNANEPSTVDVEVFYSPVFPLNWIIVTLNLRQSL